MSHLRVKTTYSVQGAYGSTETVELYCHHNLSCEYIGFYDVDGDIQGMSFGEWEIGNDLWDAMERLRFPYKDKLGEELKDKVEYYQKAPWEAQK